MGNHPIPPLALGDVQGQISLVDKGVNTLVTAGAIISCRDADADGGQQALVRSSVDPLADILRDYRALGFIRVMQIHDELFTPVSSDEIGVADSGNDEGRQLS